MSFRSWNGRRLVIAAAALHVIMAVALSVAGRTQIAPTTIDRNGIIGSFAFDSYQYQRDAIELAQLLKSGKVIDYLTAARPFHVKIIAISFAIFGPVFGYGTLGAEPYNLVFYTAVVALIFAIGREVFNRRVGLVAGAVVAVYPSFLLHTTQLLKDPLVISVSLAFVLCATTWLTRSYGARSATISASFAILTTLLIFVARTDLVAVCFITALLGLILLVIRQLVERRYLFWNMILPLSILLMAALLFFISHQNDRTKQFPAKDIGPSKIGRPELQVPSLIVRVSSTPKSPENVSARLRKPADALARQVGSMRVNFATSYPEAGSFIDSDRQFRRWTDLISYLPRAMEIGLWTPFPHSWISAGRRVGMVGGLLAGGETLFVYLCQVLAVCALFREPRRPVLWFLLAIVILGVTALALVVPNVGALYRYRYAFWLMLIVAAMAAVDELLTFVSRRLQMSQQPV